MIKFFKKSKRIIFIVVLVIILAMMGLVLKEFLYPNDIKSIYGSRLDGIEEVEIDSNKKVSVTNEIKTNNEVTKAIVDIRGKIINIIIEGKEGLTIDKSKEILNKSLNKFSDKEKEFYDFQFFATNETLKYNIIGYKNQAEKDIVWTVYSEVSENEKK